MGPNTQHHVTIYQARQPEGSDFTIPNYNTARQIRFLDERREEAACREGGQVDEEREEQNRMKIKRLLN